jgi:hypothetical protein
MKTNESLFKTWYTLIIKTKRESMEDLVYILLRSDRLAGMHVVYKNLWPLILVNKNYIIEKFFSW